MGATPGQIENLQARKYLEEINRFILHGEGEIHESPGKISLVWEAASGQGSRFLSIKLAGDNDLNINGRRFPASEAGLKQGLVTMMREIRAQERHS